MKLLLLLQLCFIGKAVSIELASVEEKRVSIIKIVDPEDKVLVFENPFVTILRNRGGQASKSRTELIFFPESPDRSQDDQERFSPDLKRWRIF